MSENFKSIRTTLVAMLLLLGGVVAQAQTVKVNVKDSSGEAVIGASVIEKDTRNGGITDLDGNFTLKSTGKPVVISYIGMKTKTIDVKGKSSINVVLEDDNTTLNDIVVMLLGLTVGCSTQASEFLTMNTIFIFVIGAGAFIIATMSGVLFVKLMNIFLLFMLRKFLLVFIEFLIKGKILHLKM